MIYPKLINNIHKNHSIESCEAFVQKKYQKEQIIDIYGVITSIITPNELLNDGSQVVKFKDRRIALPRKKKSNMQVQGEAIKNLAQKCQDMGMRFIYINLPGQCGSDTLCFEQGVYSFCDADADELIKYLNGNNICYLDLRDTISADSMDNNYFYYTDHHWTTKAGLSAARVILQYCNDEFNFDFNLDLLKNEQFEHKLFKNCWLGETGKYASKTWSKKLDDFTIIKPLYETNVSYLSPRHNVRKYGTFTNSFIDESRYNQKKASWHYSYLFSNYDYAELINNLIKNGKQILLIKDSFALVMAPFMLMPTSKIIMWDIRYNNDNLIEYLSQNKSIDLVMVAYTQGSSIAKPMMFNFFKSK